MERAVEKWEAREEGLIEKQRGAGSRTRVTLVTRRRRSDPLPLSLFSFHTSSNQRSAPHTGENRRSCEVSRQRRASFVLQRDGRLWTHSRSDLHPGILHILCRSHTTRR